MPRLALGLEYLGSPYCGWQRQAHVATIQSVLEAAVARVANAPVAVVAAGRTDAGVHALGQVVHFDAGARRSDRSWVLGINSNLPPDISVTWVREVHEEFHARYSAQARTYHYLILNRPVRSALYHQRAWWVHGDLDLAAMRCAAGYLHGEHDFSAFRAAQCQSPTPMRNLQHLELVRSGSLIVIECRANAFLHHMVRNIVGSLLMVGRGERPPEWVAEVLQKRDRRGAGMTAAAQGLYLTRVDYPPRFGLPPPALSWPGDLGALI
jgi:tRNA pseudouridine38-40 synthase